MKSYWMDRQTDDRWTERLMDGWRARHNMMMLYICTNVHENISTGFRVIEWTQFP